MTTVTRRTLRAIARLVTTLVVVAACSGVPGGDPGAVVTSAMTAIEAKDFEALKGLACAAQQDEVASQFDISSQFAELAPGIDPQQVLEAISIDTSNVTVGSPSVDGTGASVQLGGTMTVDIDAEKIKPILVAALAAQGMPTDDASIDAMIGLMGGALSGQEIPMNETLELVNENGAWKICS